MWLATSSNGAPHLVPLSFLWDSGRLLFATSATSRTGRNLLENGRARAAVGDTRDLVIVAGSVRPADTDDIASAHVFADRLGFTPWDVGESGMLFALMPREVQTWIERADADRWVMRDGHWVD